MVGLEIDPKAAAAARRAGIDVVEGALEEIPAALARQRFDVVILRHVLEHCREPDAVLRGAASLLDGGGSLVVEVPNNRALGLAEAGAAWHFLDVPRHLHFFTTRSLARTVERAGLEVEAVEYVGYHRQFSTACVEQEQAVWDGLRAAAGSTAALPRRSSLGRARALLARTLLGPPERTHDSVRVICRRVA